MQLANAVREVSSHGLLSVTKATIATSAKVFDFFATQTYSDAFKAIVCELTANAIDAQREARNPDPIHVYLPDDLDPYFRVKDTGIGMSYEFCTTNFMRYSDGSTKDGANDAIGGFGIGSKSPFAYTDQFTLRSVHNGEVSVYSVFKDEEGIPCIALLEQTPTDEINGVEFAVPVEPEDFAKFIKAAQNRLPYFLPEVRLHGAEIEEVHYLQRGQTWGVRPREGSANPQVIMGGMSYPINAHQLSWELRGDDRLGPLLEMPIDLYLPIGSCSVTLSRESLLYDDNTKAAIKTALANIVDEITADMPTMFDDQPSRWEATKALHDYLGGDQYSARSKLVLHHVKYKGDDLNCYIKPNGDFDKIWMIDPRGERRRRSVASDSCPNPSWTSDPYNIAPGNIALVIVDDLEAKGAPVKRIRAYIDDNLELKERVLVIRPWDHEDINPALEAFGNPMDFVRTSEMPEPVKVRRTSTGGVKRERPRVRMFKLTGDGDYRPTRVTPRDWRSPVREIAYVDQPDTGVLVVCDNFTLPSNFWEGINSGVVDQYEVRLVNKVDATKLADTWEMFDDVFKRRLADALANYPHAAQWKALQDSELEYLIRFVTRNPQLFDGVAKTKPLSRLIDLIEKYQSDTPSGLLRYVEAELPPRLNTADLHDRIKRDHWKFLTLYHQVGASSVTPDDTNLFKLFKELI